MNRNISEEEIIRRNMELLEGFGDHLVSTDISEKTINNHLSNVERYINEFLAVNKKAEAEYGYKYFDEYFDEWFYEFTESISTAFFKQNITSLKKFYSYLADMEVLDNQNYIELENTIKEKKSRWIENFEYGETLNSDENDKEIITDFYKAIKEYSAIAPWKWLGDTDIFAVKLKDEDEIYFCCILGNAKESYGVSVYKGVRGINTYFRVLEHDYDTEDDIATFNNCTVINLESKRYLEEHDHELINISEVEFGGKYKWPLIRVYKPGYYADLPDIDHIKILTRILKAANPFTVYLKDNMDKAALMQNGKVIVREYGDGDVLKEEYEMEYNEYFQENQIVYEIPILFDDLSIQKLKKSCKKSALIWEIDIFSMIQPVKDDEMIYYPAVLLMADAKTGMILGYDMEHPDEIENFQLYFMDHLSKIKKLPAKIILKQYEHTLYLYELFERLGIEIVEVEKLSIIPSVKKDLFDHLMR